MDRKNFDLWMEVKSKIHFDLKLPKIKDGDIWWCGVGENVGVEINGKSDFFSRPVIVFRKLSRFGFMGIPLTSQFHDGNWYVGFEFQGRGEYAVLAQSRVMSVSRLYKKMGALSEKDFESVRQGFERLFCERRKI